jgi:hypothetical protein
LKWVTTQKENMSNINTVQKMGTRIYKVDENNNILAIYNSIAEASVYENINKSTIQYRLRNETIDDGIRWMDDVSSILPSDHHILLYGYLYDDLADEFNQE